MKYKIILITVLILTLHHFSMVGQTAENNPLNIPVVSKAPINYRINVSGSTLHGYYKKGYSLTIYGDTYSIGYRADCDKDDDWLGATVGGTTQSSNSFESTYNCVFNPHSLYGTVLPGNKTGQHHYDNLKKLGVGIGDLTITYKVDKKTFLLIQLSVLYLTEVHIINLENQVWQLVISSRLHWIIINLFTLFSRTQLNILNKL